MEKNYEHIINKITKIFNNEEIINYIKKRLKANEHYIIEISNNCVRAHRLVEELEINVSDNYFTLFFTEWSTTNRYKITFLKMDDNIILNMDHNEITDTSKKFENYKYIFKDDKLLKASYLAKYHTQFKIKYETRVIDKNEKIDIYPLTENLAIKRIEKDGMLKNYLTQIENVKLENISIFTFVYSKMDEEIKNDRAKMLLK